MGNCLLIQTKDEESESGSHLGPDKATNLRKENPLNNYLILDLIFDYVPKSDWKSVRLVNKTLHSYLQPQWREQMVYKLGHEKESADVKTDAVKYLEKTHPANNSEDPFQLSVYPIRNIYISVKRNHQNILVQLDQIHFWELFGPWLKTLHLDAVRIHKVAPLKKLLFQLTPNLEELRFTNRFFKDVDNLKLNTVTEYTPPATLQNNLQFVDLCSWGWVADEKYGSAYRARFPFSWIEFFSVFPNIQKLKLDIDPYHIQRPSDLLKLFEAIDIIRKANNNQVLNITDLRMYPYGVGFNVVDVTKNLSIFASLPISTLHIPTRLFYNTDDTIGLVRTFKSTLRDLKLPLCESNYWDGIFYRNDMLGQGLTKLGLMGSKPCFSSFGFLEFTPNLEELELHHISSMLHPEVCAEVAYIPPVVTLKKFKFKLHHSKSPVAVHFLGMLMPNVTTCVCEVNRATFRIVCDMWPNLEHLCLEIVGSHTHFGNLTIVSTEDFLMELLIELKCLKTLKIIVNWTLSDKFVFEVLLELPHLTRIQIESNGMWYSCLTEKGREALKGKLCDNLFEDKVTQELQGEYSSREETEPPPVWSRLKDRAITYLISY